jgi:hypothetical protein
MKKIPSLLAVIAVFTPFLASAASGSENFAGEWADKNYHDNSVFQLSVEQSGNAVSIYFNANRKDGGGAAPEGDGKGSAKGKGELEFTWTDSFSNAGKGTIRRVGADVIVSIKPTHVADSRCLMFYGDNIRLKPAGKK